MAVFFPRKEGIRKAALSGMLDACRNRRGFSAEKRIPSGTPGKKHAPACFFQWNPSAAAAGWNTLRVWKIASQYKMPAAWEAGFHGRPFRCRDGFFLQTYLSNPAKKRQEWGLKELFYKINRGFRAFLPGKWLKFVCKKGIIAFVRIYSGRNVSIWRKDMISGGCCRQEIPAVWNRLGYSGAFAGMEGGTNLYYVKGNKGRAQCPLWQAACSDFCGYSVHCHQYGGSAMGAHGFPFWSNWCGFSWISCPVYANQSLLHTGAVPAVSFI